MKLVRLLLSDKLFIYSIAIALPMTVVGIIFRFYMSGDNIAEPLQTVLISLTTTLYVFAVSVTAKVYAQLIKYRMLAGSYDCYSYESDNENDRRKDVYYTLKSNASGAKATLEYVGGGSFLITLTGKKHINEWRGDFNVLSDSRAEIAWWYVKPDKFKDCIGYKKAVIVADPDKIRIVLFGTDNSRYGRELLVKQRD